MGKDGVREEIGGLKGSPVGDMGCCWGLWGSVRYQAEFGGGVLGLRKSLRRSGALWGAMGDIGTWAGYENTACGGRMLLSSRQDVGCR